MISLWIYPTVNNYITAGRLDTDRGVDMALWYYQRLHC